MGNDGKAARRALRSAIESWFWRATLPPPPPAEEVGVDAPPRSIRTELSSTLFSGESAEWVRYLTAGEGARYEPGVRIGVHLERSLGLLVFEPETEDSRWLAELLSFGFRELAQRLAAKPHVLKVFRELIFENEANHDSRLVVLLSSRVPSEGTRETRSQDGKSGDVRLVLALPLALTARDNYERARAASNGEKLGAIWALVARLMNSLSYPPAPRDLFVTKIDVHSRLTYIAINLLYDEQKHGLLWPTDVGSAFAAAVSDQRGVAVKELIEWDPYFRAISKVGFMLRQAPYSR